MPYIEAKLTVPLTDEKKDAIKTRFGRAVTLLRKPESYLMVGIEGDRDLWFSGKKLSRGAYVSVRLFGTPRREDCAKMSAEVTKILTEEAGIPGDSIYVSFHPTDTWAWDGELF